MESVEKVSPSSDVAEVSPSLASPSKEQHITTETEIPAPESPASTEAEAKAEAEQKHEVMEGAILSLLMGAIFPCIPVAVVCAALLSLIFKNRIEAPYTVIQQITQAHNSSVINETFTEINKLKAGGDAVYWLWAKKSTTPGTLHTIASITGKIMPFITSTSMAVVAFFAGRRIIHVTDARKQQSMPTPHQMSILISLLTGSGIKPLWETMKYRIQNHESLVQPVPLAFWSLSWIVALTLAIQGVDSWFGTALQPATVNILKLSNTTSAYGRQLNSTLCSSLWHQLPCISNASATCDYPCSVTTWNTSTGAQRFGVQHAQVAAEVLMNNSYTDFTVTVPSASTDYAQQRYFLGDKRIGMSQDFTTGTIAVSTQCAVITQNCTVGTGFTCGNYTAPSFAWTGAVGVDTNSATGPYNESSAGIQFFADSALTVPVGGNGVSARMFPSQNPVPFLVWSKGFPPVDTSGDQFTYMRENHYLGYDASGDPVFILNCSMAIYQSRYNWTNGAISADGLYNLTLADPAYGAIYTAGFALDSALGHLSLQDAAALAAYQDQPDSLANTFADEFSQAAVALTAGVMDPSQNVFEQERTNNVLVTKVPLLPLYVLIALKGVYALFALVLATLAIMVAQPLTSQNVKERLTIDGLAVGLFEADAHLKKGVTEIQQLYQEHAKSADEPPPKIGMTKNDKGGWSWATTKKLADVAGVTTVTALIQSNAKTNALSILEDAESGQKLGLSTIGSLL